MKNNVVRIYPETNKKQLKAKPFSWVKKMFQEYKNKKDRLRRYKIDYLVTQTYKLYLTIFINNDILRGAVDFHPELYLNGTIINHKALSLAMEAVTENAIKFGDKRIDECFKKCFKQFGKTKLI